MIVTLAESVMDYSDAGESDDEVLLDPVEETRTETVQHSRRVQGEL